MEMIMENDNGNGNNLYQVAAYDPTKSLALITVAESLLKANMYPSLKSPEAVFAVIQYGAELGFGPMASLQNISIIGGKPACDAKFLLALMKRAGWAYRIVESSPSICKIEFMQGEYKQLIEYSIDEAKTAGLAGKENWKKYPADMLFNRCISRASRRLAADTTLGLYTVEEMEYPIVGAENAKNITPDITPDESENQNKKPNYFSHLSSWCKEKWDWIEKFILPKCEEINEALGECKLDHPAHLINSIGEFAQSENCKKMKSKKIENFLEEFIKYRKEKYKKTDIQPEVILSGDTNPLIDESQSIVNESVQVFLSAFKSAGLDLSQNKILFLTNVAIEQGHITLDMLNSDISECANKVVAFYKNNFDL